MKSRIPLTIFFSLLLITTDGGIANQKKVVAETTSKVSTNSCVHVGRLVTIQGKLQLKRQNWSEYQPTAIGSVLCQGDLIQSTKGTRAIVQCTDSNQNLWIVPAGLTAGVESGCQPPDEPVYTRTRPIPPTRDPLASGIPDIITPKQTWLLGNKPTLRWIAVPGTTVYVVKVSGPGVHWVREVNATSIVYPGNPPLRAGEGYLMVVNANNGATAKTIFSLLDEKRAALVRTAVERIARQNLNDEAKALAIAEVYVGQGLTTEATELLETLVGKNTKTVAIYQMLGDLFVQVRLLRQAESNYLKAVDLAAIGNDIEGQAVAAARLGEVYAALGNSDAATYWHKQAQKGYQILLSSQPVAN
ncbi:MAG: hypothetical protein KME05_05275 [Gloeocapsa sp. UFS-A4-WI-NPMV-4B04]|nr:hypothetical protein [Gloeocapsa sp. UFS-A4-WI-NPMV-4B04]